MVLAVAFGARIIAVGVLFLLGLPYHNDLSVGALSGDEAYNLARTLRIRDIRLGLAGGAYDYFVATDEYGRTSYLELLTQLQTAFGPAPYGLRVFNATAFIAGAVILYRAVRPAFGPLPALCGLVAVLFLPSVFYASISLLKESVYFFVSSAFVAASMRVVRARSVARGALALAVIGASLWVLEDLRRGALVLATAGIGCGLLLRVVGAARWRLVAAAVVVAVGLVVAARSSLLARGIDTITPMAKLHTGHVFTVGHDYKLLDDGFYMRPATPSGSSITLTPPQAARFVIRSAVSFVVTPAPWEMRSLGELAFLPEHLLWYLVLAFLPFGVVAGWRKDSLVTAVMAGWVLPTAVALALTNGNVGTLLRLRGLVTPYWLWIAVVGVCVALDALARRGGRTSGAVPAAESTWR